MKKSQISVTIIILLFSCSLFAKRNPKPGVETFKLADNVYKIYVHNFVNMLVFTGPDGVLLVDSGMEPVDIIQKELQKISAAPVKYIINTHSNGDHFLGNTLLGPNATIIASTACREDILKRDSVIASDLPNITFDDEMTIHFNGEKIDLYFMPGHTGNDIVVHFNQSKIVCVGDLVFSDSFPGIQKVRGGNVFDLEKTLYRLSTEFPDDVTFMVSHIREYTMEEMKAYHQMTKKTIEIVKPLILAGLSLDEVKAKNPLKDWIEWNSKYFPGEITTDTWIDNIYESLN